MIAAALAEQGVDVPDDVRPVDVWPSAAPYRVAFDVLSASRPEGPNGWLAIPYPWIVAYAHENGYAESVTELEEFVSFVQAQDRVFLDESRKAAKTKTGAH